MPPSSHHKLLSHLLFLNCAFIFIMLIIGGATRLTGSGLSIVHWDLIKGILPPLTSHHWEQIFLEYQKSPEFIYLHQDMILSGFKKIFWLEYIHRLWGRWIGIYQIILIIFTFKNSILRQSYGSPMISLALLIGLQGLMGWYMVKSGLANDPHVSPYRLTAHLLLAFLAYAISFYYGLKLAQKTLLISKGFILALTFMILTIFYGGLVAGLKAGLLYNTFPLMDGHLFPENPFAQSPWYLNFFENHGTVQFLHRLFAMVTLTILLHISLTSLKNWRRWSLLTSATVQVSLGVFTLVLQVPLELALSHQMMAMILLTTLFLSHTHAFSQKKKEMLYA